MDACTLYVRARKSRLQQDDKQTDRQTCRSKYPRESCTFFFFFFFFFAPAQYEFVHSLHQHTVCHTPDPTTRITTSVDHGHVYYTTRTNPNVCNCLRTWTRWYVQWSIAVRLRYRTLLERCVAKSGCGRHYSGILRGSGARTTMLLVRIERVRSNARTLLWRLWGIGGNHLCGFNPAREVFVGQVSEGECALAESDAFLVGLLRDLGSLVVPLNTR
jgi:hypothetical protein